MNGNATKIDTRLVWPFDDQEDHCEDLSYGTGNWRLATYAELFSLADYSRPQPPYLNFTDEITGGIYWMNRISDPLSGFNEPRRKWKLVLSEMRVDLRTKFYRKLRHGRSILRAGNPLAKKRFRMKKHNLGKSRLQVAPIAYGFWRFGGTDVKTARTKVETALEMGINLMDHADIYGVDGGGQFGDAELLFGKVLQEAPHLRDQMVLATKGGIVLGVPYDSSGDYIEQAVNNSLKRLGVDVIDLWQIHRPDFLGHPEEIAATLTKLAQTGRGKIKEVGVSNYTASQFRAPQAHLSFPIASHQPEFLLLGARTATRWNI